MDWLEVVRVIPATPREVRRMFWAIEDWTRIWDPLTSATVTYDDGVHQEVEMTVVRDGRPERVRTARFFTGEQITFFSPTPPPSMSAHRGAWAFASDPGGCRLTARRQYRLLREPGEAPAEYASRRDVYRARFLDRLGHILDAFVGHYDRTERSA